MSGTVLKSMGVFAIVVLLALTYVTYDGLARPIELSAQEPERPTLTGDDVVEHDWSEYNKKYPIENSYFVINQGEKVDDGCRFTVAGLRGTSNRPTMVRQLAVKPSTCEELLEVGDMSVEAEEAYQQEEPSDDHKTSSVKPNQGESITEGYQGSPNLKPALLPDNQALLTVRFLDAPTGNWPHTRVETYLDWEYDDTADEVYYLDGEIDRWWLSSAGWEKDDDYDEGWWSYQGGQYLVFIETSTHYERPPGGTFCPSDWTDVYYDDNRVYGFNDGSADYYVDAFATGDCAWRLARQIEFNTTY